MIINNGILVSIESKDIIDGKIVIPSTVREISSGCLIELEGTSAIREIEIEEGVEEISDNAFSHLSSLESVKFPSSLKIIGKDAFTYCRRLKKADLPDNIEVLGSHAFSNTGLERVRLPQSLKDVGVAVFSECEALTEADVEFKLEKIPINLFYDCSSLKKVKLAKEIKVVGDSAFAYCTELQDIDLSNIEKVDSRGFLRALSGEVRLDSIRVIADYAFAQSSMRRVYMPDVNFLGEYAFFESNLEEVTLPTSAMYFQRGVFSSCRELTHVDLSHATYLPQETFENCPKLESVTGFDILTTIEQRCFTNCKSLRKADFVENVENIGQSAFLGCSGLRFIKLNKVKKLDESAFSQCEQLRSVDLSESELKTLGKEAFEYCYRLKDVILPSTCEVIGENCFNRCRSLRKIDLPESLRNIGAYAFRSSGLNFIAIPENASCEAKVFYGCRALREVVIHSNKFDMDNLFGCSRLKSIKADSDCELSGSLYISNDKFKTIQKSDKDFLFTRSTAKAKGYDEVVRIKDFNELEPVCIQMLWDKRKRLQSDVQKAKVRDVYLYMYLALDHDQFKEFVSDANLKFYKKIPILNMVDENNPNRRPISETSELFCMLYYNLGGFLPPQKETRITKSGKEIEETVDYAQRVGEFFISQLEKKNPRLGRLVEHLSAMQLHGLKPEFTKFLIDPKNFDAMMDEEENNPGFIAECYNKFEEIQKTNTSNRGGQRQLKPTVGKFIDYFRQEKFKGVTEETAPIARTIAPYFSSQTTFEDAVKINQERIEHGIPDDILEHPVQADDAIELIRDYAKKIRASASKTTKLLAEMSDTALVTEWLKKSDPKNFILGKLCDCCAHLEGAGYGIMHASIVDPDVQNLVIKDSEGQIIAKSTLYVNREQGYGVFNNVEINHDIIDSKTLLKIHDKFKLAAAVFARKYNKEHPDRPISIITVGMGNNDLEAVITKKDERAPYPFSALHYATYGGHWNGDSFRSQYTIWESDEKE